MSPLSYRFWWDRKKILRVFPSSWRFWWATKQNLHITTHFILSRFIFCLLKDLTLLFQCFWIQILNQRLRHALLWFILWSQVNTFEFTHILPMLCPCLVLEFSIFFLEIEILERRISYVLNIKQIDHWHALPISISYMVLGGHIPQTSFLQFKWKNTYPCQCRLHEFYSLWRNRTTPAQILAKYPVRLLYKISISL